MIVKAPHPSYTAFITLPDPELQDTANAADVVDVKIMMDASVMTNVKTQTTKKVYQFLFDLTRMKILELKAFIDLYAGEQWAFTWQGENVVANLMVNPTDFEIQRRAWFEAGNAEAGQISLTFESV
jgi:hypothetical protein